MLVAAFLVVAFGAGAPVASAACRTPATEIDGEGAYDTSGLRIPALGISWPADVAGAFDDERLPDGWRLGPTIPDEELTVGRCRDGRGLLTLHRYRGPYLDVGPSLAPGERIGGMAWTGRFVAWRTWRPGRRGRIHVARLGRRGVVGRVRTVSTQRLPRRAAFDPRIAVTSDGVVLWTLLHGHTDRTWVSAPGRRVRTLIRAAPRRGDLVLFDDAHVLTTDATDSSARLVAFRRGHPGACSGRGDDGAVNSHPAGALGGWCLRITSGRALGWGDEMDEHHILWLYRPDTHRVLATFDEYDSADRYGSSFDCVCRIVRAGSLAIAQTDGSGQDPNSDDPRSSEQTAVTDTVSGRTFQASGVLGSPDAEPGERVSALVVDGAAAWLEDHTGSPSTVWVRDAGGVRSVGEAEIGGPGLALDGRTLRWTPDDGAASVTLQPRADDVRATWSPSPARRR
ncbi:hypothetical protein AB0L40_04745 [Patulibacter sp. NPDC049589]|uniref:hypothetical protein n=1 Tax=Patulibacter sp. NPDC049589 TaxID=3154731 RepID=UPI00343BB5D6